MKKNKKTIRQPYRGSRAIDRSCRCHGSCEWCQRNRQASTNRRKLAADAKYLEYKDLER